MLKGLRPDVDLDRGRAQANGWLGSISCPFHGTDRIGSASYNPGTQRFRCHTCGLSGDGIDLIQQLEGLDWASARARATELCDGVFIQVESSGGVGTSKLASKRTLGRSKMVRQKYGRRKGL